MQRVWCDYGIGKTLCILRHGPSGKQVACLVGDFGAHVDAVYDVLKNTCFLSAHVKLKLAVTYCSVEVASAERLLVSVNLDSVRLIPNTVVWHTLYGTIVYAATCSSCCHFRQFGTRLIS